MISLLERFYDPTTGKILLNGNDIHDYTADSYRKNLSLVAQESTLYDGMAIRILLWHQTDPNRYHQGEHCTFCRSLHGIG
jgi:ABC-type bacteriocin/lantibiotic exporter with double-glycine peptidase domain